MRVGAPSPTLCPFPPTVREKAAFAAGHNGDSKSGALTLEFAQLSFARAHTKFCKLAAALEKGKGPAGERWATIVAAARGFDQVIYTAITGPNRKQYNGSRGETGIEVSHSPPPVWTETR